MFDASREGRSERVQKGRRAAAFFDRETRGRGAVVLTARREGGVCRAARNQVSEAPDREARTAGIFGELSESKNGSESE